MAPHDRNGVFPRGLRRSEWTVGDECAKCSIGRWLLVIGHVRLAVATGKGGVGKTSLVSNVGATVASLGYKVLIIDLDPQANVGDDLGYTNTPDVDDNGQGLLEALLFDDRPLRVVRNVRENLDVVVGGQFVADAEDMRKAWERRGRTPELALAAALRATPGEYDLVLFDSPPGKAFLQRLVLAAATHVVIPTRADRSSIAGITRLAQQFAAAREHNPSLELLGVVVFGVQSSETRLLSRVREKVEENLGEVAPVFNTSIRYLAAPATDAREVGMAVFEYARDVVEKAPPWYEARSKGKSAVAVSPTAGKLASDYALLTAEILTALSPPPNEIVDVRQSLGSDHGQK